MSVLGVILARAGSRGAPGKNTMMIAGAPCVRWTIDAGLEALRRGALDVLCVSTDCESVTREAINRGAAVVARPVELATGEARVDDTVRHALGVIEQRMDITFSAVAILYANVPVRPAGLIERAVAMLRATGCDSVQSYSPSGKMHPWWTARVDPGTGEVLPFIGDRLNHGVYRRQDLPPAYVPDGGVLVVTREALCDPSTASPQSPHAFFGTRQHGVLTAQGDVIDIDDAIDAVVADAVLRKRLEVEQELHESLGQDEAQRRRIA